MKRFIEKYELLDDFSERKIGKFSMEFKPGINLIIGENGSGKSTLIKLLIDEEFVKKHSSLKQKIHLSEETIKNGIGFMLFDTEKDNPRIADLQNYSGNFGYALTSHFKSHGETIFPIIDHIKGEENKVVFIDEPEAGISSRNQLLLWEAFKKAEKNGCQLFISTHSYVLISNTESVFDMETKEWINSEEYLEQFINK